MKVDAATLPDNTTQLKQMLVDFQDHYDKETGLLLEQISHLRAQLFGRKSEKIHDENGPQPLPLFDMPEPGGNEDDDEKEDIIVPAHTRKRRGRKALPADLPRIERIHDINEADKICG